MSPFSPHPAPLEPEPEIPDFGGYRTPLGRLPNRFARDSPRYRSSPARASRGPDYPDNGGGPGVTVFTYALGPPPPDTEQGPLTRSQRHALLDQMVANSAGAPFHDAARTVLTRFDHTRLGRVVVRRLHQLTEVYVGCDPYGPVPGALVDGLPWRDPRARIELRAPAPHTITGW